VLHSFALDLVPFATNHPEEKTTPVLRYRGLRSLAEYIPKDRCPYCSLASTLQRRRTCPPFQNKHSGSWLSSEPRLRASVRRTPWKKARSFSLPKIAAALVPGSRVQRPGTALHFTEGLRSTMPNPCLFLHARATPAARLKTRQWPPLRRQTSPLRLGPHQTSISRIDQLYGLRSYAELRQLVSLVKIGKGGGKNHVLALGGQSSQPLTGTVHSSTTAYHICGL
jgi:hypothetical protein